MPLPLLILGALALAGGGAIYAFSGSRGEPSKSSTGSPASSALTAAGSAEKPKASKKKKKLHFGAATGLLPSGGNGARKDMLPPAARYSLMRDYANVAAEFEATYDKAKNKEGVGGIVDKAGAVANVGGAVFSLGLVGDISDVKEFSADLKQQVGGGKAGSWKGHEIAAARMVSLAQVPPDHVTKNIHRGEEYTWSRFLVFVPGYGLIST